MNRPERDTRTYITVHDGIFDHPKVAGLSDRSFRSLIELWCYCSRQLTDGFVSDAIWRKRVLPRVRAELIDAELVVMHHTGRGVFMHDYLKHQRSAAEVADLREKRRSAGRKGGIHRAVNAAHEAANDQANVQAEPKQMLEQTPSKTQPETVSVTVSEKDSVVQLVSRLTKQDARTTTTTIQNDAKIRAPLANLTLEAAAFLELNHGRWSQIRNPSAAWRAWLDKANERNKPTISAKTTPCTEHPDQPAGRCQPCEHLATPDVPPDWRNRATTEDPDTRRTA